MDNREIYADFFYEALSMTHGDLLFDGFNLEPWELSNILLHLKTDETNWSKNDLSVKGYKNYDEEGNSYDVGILQVNASGYTKEDFQDLSRLWHEAERLWKKSSNH